jgi:hypothetical protein
MSEEMDERYASFREFADLHRAHAALDASVTNQLNNIAAGMSDIKTMLLRPQVDHNALAAHRAIEALPQTLSQALASNLSEMKSSNNSPFTIVLSYVGAAACAGMDPDANSATGATPFSVGCRSSLSRRVPKEKALGPPASSLPISAASGSGSSRVQRVSENSMRVTRLRAMRPSAHRRSCSSW